MTTGRYILGKFREALISALPIGVVVLAFFLITRFALPADYFSNGDVSYSIVDNQMIAFGISCVMIMFGMTLFSIGTERSMTEIGEIVGSSLVKKNKFFFVIAMTFILGVLVTVAEPDLNVLASQIGIEPLIIIITIGVGVGLFLVVGIIRVSLKQDLNVLFLAFYGLAFAMIYFIDPRYLPICFDSGGVTTGPVTVPFLLGFGLGIAASRHGKNSEDSFGLTALCSIGPILATIVISLVLKAMGKDLPVEYLLTISDGSNVWKDLLHSTVSCLSSVSLSVVPILAFFLIYQLIFIHLPFRRILSIVAGMAVTYVGLVLFLTAVEWGFMPIAQKVGLMLGTKESLHIIAIAIGAGFGIFGVLAEPAVHVLTQQMENVSDGHIKKNNVLIVLALTNGIAVGLQILRCHFQFSLAYYIIPGYVIAFVLSFLVPKIYTAMAFDSGGVASGPMTSTFVLPFCIGFAASVGTDVYLYGFGLVAMVAMMPLIVVQAMGLQSKIVQNYALARARKRIVEEDDDQIVHFDWEAA